MIQTELDRIKLNISGTHTCKQTDTKQNYTCWTEENDIIQAHTDKQIQIKIIDLSRFPAEIKTNIHFY